MPQRWSSPCCACDAGNGLENTMRRRTRQAMKKTPLFEITVTGAEYGEWQGMVTFPASGKQMPFGSLLELMRIVKQNMPMPDTRED